MAEVSAQRRAKLVRLELKQLGSQHCRATVELEWRDQTYVGTADEMGSEPRELRCAATAAVDALGRVVAADGATFELRDLKTIDGFSSPPVIVTVLIHYRDETLHMVGASLAKEDPPEAAVRSVLNATNRFVERLGSTPR